MKFMMAAIFLLFGSAAARANGDDFSTHLFPKFQVKACTKCHDFHNKELEGLSFGDHKGRKPNTCVMCHSSKVTGFEHKDEWFAMPGLYTSAMNAQQTCEAINKALHAEFKNQSLVARQMQKHLFEDPRVLWAIEGATPQSGKLPQGKVETDLVKGGLEEWKAQVTAWIEGGMECE